MLSLNLIPHKKNQDELILSLGNGHRFFFYLLAIFFLYLIFTDDKGTGSNLGPVIISVICFLSGSYHEVWIFNRKTRLIEHRLGFVFLFRRKKIQMDDIKSIKMTGFIRKRHGRQSNDKRGFPPVAFLKLLMIQKDGNSLNVETIKSRDVHRIEEKAQLIASFCEVAVVSDDVN